MYWIPQFNASIVSYISPLLCRLSANSMWLQANIVIEKQRGKPNFTFVYPNKVIMLGKYKTAIIRTFYNLLKVKTNINQYFRLNLTLLLE